MDIEALLNELEKMGDEGDRWHRRWLPSLSRTCVDADKFFALIDKIRSSLPAEVKTEQEVALQREQMIEEAQEERAKILEAARQQAELLISSERIVQESQRRADEVTHQAKVEADSIRADADEYARTLLTRLEETLQRTLATVTRGRDMLQEKAEYSSGEDSP
jgi:vacuolar-type H+-ATPase subunit H